jgi:hypothetical protein
MPRNEPSGRADAEERALREGRRRGTSPQLERFSAGLNGPKQSCDNRRDGRPWGAILAGKQSFASVILSSLIPKRFGDSVVVGVLVGKWICVPQLVAAFWSTCSNITLI